MTDLNELSQQIYEGNKQRGFNVAKENVGQTLMLVVSELAEALEADRKNKHAEMDAFEFRSEDRKCSEDFKCDFKELIKDSFEDEIADAIIRLFDLCGGLNIDIERHIKLKLEYNETREYKHGKLY